jgi:hypothetical protein
MEAKSQLESRAPNLASLGSLFCDLVFTSQILRLHIGCYDSLNIYVGARDLNTSSHACQAITPALKMISRVHMTILRWRLLGTPPRNLWKNSLCVQMFHQLKCILLIMDTITYRMIHYIVCANV